MPIRLNLLAEAQAAEDVRRRDPVKRVIVIGALLAALMLVWSGSLQLMAMFAKGELYRAESRMATRTNDYQLVQDNWKKLGEVNLRLSALRRLSTNRFLNGTLLNALQQAIVDDVQLTHLKVEQTYSYAEELKARTNGTRVLPPKPATITERIVLKIDAKDSSSNPGDQVNKFKETVATQPYFETALGKTNIVRLISQLPAQSGGDSRPFVLFTLECRYPEVTR